MIDIRDKKDCCGCNACGDACPEGAISFEADGEGFWYPRVDVERCTGCGLCDRTCPVKGLGGMKNDNYKEPKAYAAIHKNNQVRFDSTSGGMFTALAEPFIRDGGFVGGAAYSDGWSVRQILTDSLDDLGRLRSSKYIQSDASGYYESVRRLLDGGKKVMAVGLPCQIAALRLFLGGEREGLLTVDLICRYINSPLAYRKYLDWLEDEYGSRVAYIKAKNKELGWRQLTHKVVFENGATYYGTYGVDKFMKASMRGNCLSRPACYECPFKGFPRIADISLGDYWCKRGECSLDDDAGTSVVIVNSARGAVYFERARRKIRAEEVPLGRVVDGNPALLRPLEKTSIDRGEFFERIMSEPFGAVVDDMCAERESVRHKAATVARALAKEARVSRLRPKALWQFLHLNFFHRAVHSDLSKGHLLYVAPHCDVEVSKGASIILNGYLVLGGSVFKHTKVETRLRMQDGARMEIGGLSTGGYGFGYGSDIEIFSGAELVSKGGPSTNMGTTIICQGRIVIGEMVAIGRNVTIRDNNGGHLINVNGYMDHRPVIIGEHVWLCEQCTVMPGVRIGDGSIIGARSVVTRSVPPHVVAAGNPAQVGSEGVEWKM